MYTSKVAYIPGMVETQTRKGDIGQEEKQIN